MNWFDQARVESNCSRPGPIVSSPLSLKKNAWGAAWVDPNCSRPGPIVSARLGLVALQVLQKKRETLHCRRETRLPHRRVASLLVVRSAKRSSSCERSKHRQENIKTRHHVSGRTRPDRISTHISKKTRSDGLPPAQSYYYPPAQRCVRP